MTHPEIPPPPGIAGTAPAAAAAPTVYVTVVEAMGRFHLRAEDPTTKALVPVQLALHRDRYPAAHPVLAVGEITTRLGRGHHFLAVHGGTATPGAAYQLWRLRLPPKAAHARAAHAPAPAHAGAQTPPATLEVGGPAVPVTLTADRRRAHFRFATASSGTYTATVAPAPAPGETCALTLLDPSGATIHATVTGRLDVTLPAGTWDLLLEVPAPETPRPAAVAVAVRADA
jgi:hypothetical protein